MDALGIFASILGHIGDGNFHESIMYNRRDPAQRARVEKCVHDMVDRALAMEGSCTVVPPPLPASLFILILPTPFAVRHKETQLTRMCLQGEHGIGIGKKDSLLKELGPDTIDVMRSLKRALDPHWLLNPGKIFDYSRDSKSEKLISEAVDLDAARLVGA